MPPIREVTVEDPSPPTAGPQLTERRTPPHGPGVAPVEVFAPKPADAPGIEEILRRALPGLQASVKIVRNLPRWLEDDIAELPPTVAAGMHEKLAHLAHHGARLEAGLRAAGACAQIADHRLRLRPVDVAPMIEQVLRQRMGSTGRRLEMHLEVPEAVTDAELLCGIVGGLCDAAISNARRDTDRIEIRAMHTGGTLRLSALYPGPPIELGDGARLFDGTPRDGALEPAAGLGLVYVWQAVARLGGRIELGPGFRGVGARITAILPPAEADRGT